MQALLDQKDNIRKLIEVRETTQLHEESHKFIADVLNLVFGRGEETDYFWDQMLFRECAITFGIREAMQYHNYQDGIEQILNRARVNLTALFFAIVHLLNLSIDPFFSEKANGTSGFLESKKGS